MTAFAAGVLMSTSYPLFGAYEFACGLHMVEAISAITHPIRRMDLLHIIPRKEIEQVSTTFS